ncbi:MAG: DUF1801 domain-containing protein [SAR202 cluster bacterium]|nr:DUF1801 domain-containing protein [SAR202 cluster bacterium]
MAKSAEVNAWFAAFEHPLKDAMLLAREVILAADPRIEECIKWKTPTFTFKGNLASFNPRSKSHVSLLFHTGAHIPGSHPRLEGGADTARYMKFADAADVKAQKADLERVVRAWCDWKAG